MDGGKHEIQMHRILMEGRIHWRVPGISLPLAPPDKAWASIARRSSKPRSGPLDTGFASSRWTPLNRQLDLIELYKGLGYRHIDGAQWTGKVYRGVMLSKSLPEEANQPSFSAGYSR